jgi:hypothetical protein
MTAPEFDDWTAETEVGLAGAAEVEPEVPWIVTAELEARGAAPAGRTT